MPIHYSPNQAVTLCVNACETTSPHVSPDDIEALLANTCAEAGFPFCERLYVGSYFCENYFLGLSDRFHKCIREICGKHELKATLVIPRIGQAFLPRFQEQLAHILDEYADVYDEIIANDVACFVDLVQWYAGVGSWPSRVTPSHNFTPPRIGLGRLFSKEMRDARYANLRESTTYAALSPEAQACIDEQRNKQPWGRPLVEIDPMSSIVDVAEIAPQAEIAIHLPYCYATTGRNCGPASISEPDSRKFQLGRACSQHCLRMVQGCLTDEDAAYVKHGRTYYYANPNCQITGTDAWRIVYAASSEMMRPAQRNEIFANEFPTHNEV